jgi:glucose uptake protein GlcU
MGGLKDEVRVIVIRLLLVTATFGSVMGFNFTHFPGFVILPFAAGVVLVALVLTSPKEGYDAARRAKNRRAGFVQLGISSCMVIGFLIYAIVKSETGQTIGFSIMLGTLLVLAVLALWSYYRAREIHRLKCEEIKESTRIYGHEGGTAGADEPGRSSGPSSV